MKTLFVMICLTALSACSGLEPNVKERWTKNLTAYSFVPMYPPREDVHIGDIRIHRKTGGSSVLDSRLLWDWNTNPVVTRQPDEVVAILPGIEVIRLGAVDVKALGLTGLLTQVFGTRIEATNSLHIALTDLTTAEASDIAVAQRFRSFIDAQFATAQVGGSHSDAVVGFCAGAITLDYDSLEDIRISIVTRTLRVGKIEYFSGGGVSTIDGASNPAQDASNPKGLDGQTGVAVTAAAVINDKQTLKKPIVIGVDALTLKPAAINPSLVDICEAYKIEFDEARL